MRTKLLVGFWMVFVVGIIFLSPSDCMAQTFDHDFVGVSKCSLCHKKADIGQQVIIWQGTAHAKAFETLGTPKAKELGAKLGVDNPQTSGKCLKCHSTAYGFTENKVTEKVPVQEGVSCESCHGPGKDYMRKSVMQDKQEAIANGLIMPDEKTCVKCHNSESPAMTKPFDFKQEWDKIKHPIPKSN